MKYKLYNALVSDDNKEGVIEHVLHNRGIGDVNKYMDIVTDSINVRDLVVTPYRNLRNIHSAVNMLMEHAKIDSNIAILVDEDVDGFCSAAMMYSYLVNVLHQCNVSYILHQKAKAHGITDDVTIPDGTDLLIVPDAGSNDLEQCAKLNAAGIDVLILDHHEFDNDIHNKFAIPENTVIVNNQNSPQYPNKDLCGAGIVYRFLEMLDEEQWEESADNYIDLCALANISDVMDMRSFETRYFVRVGLRNIKNKCLKAFIESQSYRMGNDITIHNIQWYITPILNGLIRMGTNEEKELLFRAFIETDEIFEYKTKATKNKPSQIIDETIYARAARLASNAKSRQDRERNKSVKIITESVIPNNDKIIVINGTDIVHSSLTGIVAIQISEKYKKPCIIYRKCKQLEDVPVTYGGSARNFSHSPVTDLKKTLLKTQLFNFARGHANAFGFEIDEENISQVVNKINNALIDIEYDKTYLVDYILNTADIDIGMISDISKLNPYYGQGIDECLVAVEQIELTRENCYVVGTNEDSIKFYINDIEFIQFKCQEGNPLYDFINDGWGSDGSIKMNIVGTPCLNKYNGLNKPQIIIKDLETI